MFPVMFALEICDVEFSYKHDKPFHGTFHEHKHKRHYDFDIYVSKFYKPDL